MSNAKQRLRDLIDTMTERQQEALFVLLMSQQDAQDRFPEWVDETMPVIGRATENAVTEKQAQDDDEDYPTTMEEVHQYLDRSRAKLLAVVEPLGDEEITRLGPEGWSVKDHLAHLAVWEGSMTAVLTGRAKAEGLGVPKEVLARPGYDETNELIRARWADASRPEVMGLLASTRAELLATLGAMTYDDLMKPYASYQPGAPDKTDPVAYWLAGNTWEHIDEHLPWIEGLLGRGQ